jgi:hypothetical protein
MEHQAPGRAELPPPMSSSSATRTRTFSVLNVE